MKAVHEQYKQATDKMVQWLILTTALVLASCNSGVLFLLCQRSAARQSSNVDREEHLSSSLKLLVFLMPVRNVYEGLRPLGQRLWLDNRLCQNHSGTRTLSNYSATCRYACHQGGKDGVVSGAAARHQACCMQLAWVLCDPCDIKSSNGLQTS